MGSRRVGGSGFDRDLARLTLLGLGDDDGQNAIMVLRIDFVLLDMARQRDRTKERAVIAFDEMRRAVLLILFLAVRLFALPFSADRQNVVGELNLDFTRFDSWQVGLSTGIS